MPTLTAVSPTTAPNQGVVTLDFAGSGLDHVMTVKLVQGVVARYGSIISATPSTLRTGFDLTGLPVGAYDAVVVNHDSVQAMLPGGFAVTAAPLPKPQVSRLRPTAGKRKSTVTISGKDFGARRGSGFVKFGTKRRTAYVSWSATPIKCKVPAKAKLAKVRVRVTTAGGLSNAKSFRVKR